MNRARWIQRVLSGEDKRFPAVLLRGILTPLAWLHFVGLELYLIPWKLGWRKPYRLPCPVIVVGNLSSGGTGKTPMAALVAGYLRDSGKRVVLLSRGHGGTHETGRVPHIVSDGQTIVATPDAAGDEPVLLARLLPGVPVIVCRDRRKSGRLAVEQFAPEIIVCDDGFQYWRLYRDLNIVLLDASRPFDNGAMLPRGLLREPPSHLSRAHIIVLTRADRVPPDVLSTTIADVQHFAPNADIFTATHTPVAWVRGDGTTLLAQHGPIAQAGTHKPRVGDASALETIRGKRAFVFSGIADGTAFVRSVAALGVRVEENSYSFGDHHRYTEADIAFLLAKADKETEVFLTTEKDLVKVGLLWPDKAPPLYALRVEMQIRNVTTFFARLNLSPPSGKSIHDTTQTSK